MSNCRHCKTPKRYPPNNTVGYCPKWDCPGKQKKEYSPLRRTRIPSKSSPLTEYSKACREVDNDPKKRNCAFCDLPIVGQADHHHLLGRTGTLIKDPKYIVKAHRLCHTHQYHSMGVEQLEKLDWYSGFLKRMKTDCPRLYEKELRKKEKVTSWNNR